MDVAEAAAAIRALRPPNDRPPTFNVHLKAGRRSGELVLRTNDVVIGFPGKPLFAAEDIELRRQECAALIGPNGSGKTTFLRTILGQMEPLAGEVRPGASLEIGYLAQAHEGLDLENPLVEELMRHHPMGMAEARNTLARYLFRQDDVFKRVGDLSGGERGRLALAILALKGANFLLLDEPTNHLDVPAQEMLQEVLEQFEGTILLVSHDRYLVDRLATQLWYLERGRLRVFKGPYQEYLAERDRQAEVAKEAAASRRAPETRNGRPGGKSDVAARQRASRLGELEHEIGRAEARLEEIGRALQAGAAAEAFDRIQSLGLEYAAAERHLEGLLAEWEDLAREQTLA
jgi:ATP-binding cassette subfamily F protein 3